MVSGPSLMGSIGIPLDDWSIFLHIISGGRYFLYGNLILLVLLMAPSLGKWSRARNLAALVLVALFINSAQWSYSHARWIGPSWPAEVEAWRQDPERPIRIWPKDWVLELDPEKVR